MYPENLCVCVCVCVCVDMNGEWEKKGFQMFTVSNFVHKAIKHN